MIYRIKGYATLLGLFLLGPSMGNLAFAEQGFCRIEELEYKIPCFDNVCCLAYFPHESEKAYVLKAGNNGLAYFEYSKEGKEQAEEAMVALKEKDLCSEEKTITTSEKRLKLCIVSKYGAGPYFSQSGEKAYWSTLIATGESGLQAVLDGGFNNKQEAIEHTRKMQKQGFCDFKEKNSKPNGHDSNM